MKPDYNIGARNGLLEGKHMIALGSAIWLYLWFLDKQPRNSNKVLGGQPVTYNMFAHSFPNVPRITYVRWMAVMETSSYIELLRTPRGYVVTITKPKKWLKSDVSPKQHHKDDSGGEVSKSGASDVSPTKHPMSDVSKMIHAEDVSSTEHPIRRVSLDSSSSSEQPHNARQDNTAATAVFNAIIAKSVLNCKAKPEANRYMLEVIVALSKIYTQDEIVLGAKQLLVAGANGDKWLQTRKPGERLNYLFYTAQGGKARSHDGRLAESVKRYSDWIVKAQESQEPQQSSQTANDGHPVVRRVFGGNNE